jgi:hypothetical protein
MSVALRRERMAAVGLVALIAVCPVAGASGLAATTDSFEGAPETAPLGPTVADTGEMDWAVDVVAMDVTGPFASHSRDAGTAAGAPTVAPDLGQAATPTATPSPAASTVPGTIGRSPDVDGLDPVLVLSGLIAVVLLALGVWFLLR